MGEEQARIEERRVKVARMYLGNKTQHEIAIALGVNRTTIESDLHQLQRQWRAAALIDFDEAKAREIAKIDNLERMATDAWERSMEPIEVKHRKVEKARKYEKPKLDKNGKPKRQAGKPSPAQLIPVKIVQEIKRTGQAGNPAFLERIAWCIEMRAKITGVIKEKVTINNLVGFKWDDFLDPPKETTADEIERQIAEVRQLPAPTEGNSNGSAQTRDSQGSSDSQEA